MGARGLGVELSDNLYALSNLGLDGIDGGEPSGGRRSCFSG